MPLLLILAALEASLPPLGQTPSTNLSFFQRFVSGEVPFREIVWKTRGLPPPIDGPPEGWETWRFGCISNSTFIRYPKSELDGVDGSIVGASRSQYWCVDLTSAQTVDRDKTEPSFLGVRSTPFQNGSVGISWAMAFRSLGLPPLEAGTVRWNSDGTFEALETRWLLGDDTPRKLTGRIVRQNEFGPLEIEFRSGFDEHSKRVTYSYGTNLGVALPERIARYSSKDTSVRTGEVIIEKVNLDVSDLSPEGFTPWMFTQPNWSTNLITWTNSTVYPGPRSPGSKRYVPWVESLYWKWFNFRQRFR